MARFVEILQGLPASGKSAYAKERVKENPHQIVRVNKDDLRAMMHNSVHGKDNEKQIREVESLIIKDSLQRSKSVIVDSTNFSKSNIERIQVLAALAAVPCTIKYFDVPWEECVCRNVLRDQKVPDDVIRSMHGRYVYVRGFVPTTSNKKTELPKYILVDVDGTLADCTHREHYVSSEGKKDWQSFFSLSTFDPLREDVVKLIEEKYSGIPRVVVTAREESWRPHTEKWLREKGFQFENILMRKSGDKRADAIVKQEILDLYCDVDNVIAVIDDRPRVIEMWQANGLHVENVGEDRWKGRE